MFASALDWPGWARSARDEEGALATLLDYRERFAVVAERAGLRVPATPTWRVVERLAGDAGTDFGAPMKPAARETERTSATQGARLAALVAAAWDVLDTVAASAPAQLRKGPRGGGRDRDAVVAHVRDAEVAYARKLAIPTKTADRRAAILAVLSRRSDGRPLVDNGWPVRYAARRIAWHALDHAWEIEDRSG